MDARRKVVAVVGDGKNPLDGRIAALAEWIAQSGYHLLTGGGGGVMAAVSEAFVECVGHKGLAIGVIPGSVAGRGGRVDYRTKGAAYPNDSVELAIFTHLSGEDPEGKDSRNHINVLSADLVIGLPGGPGTHAEIQLAKRYGKPVILFLGEDEMIRNKTVGDLAGEGFTVVCDFLDFIRVAHRITEPERALRRPEHLALEKCVLRSWRWEDADAVQRHANNRKVWRNLHDGFPSPYTLRDAHRWLAHALSSPADTALAIEVDGEAAGGIGFVLKEGPWACSAEIGYWLGESHWGRGVATNALEGISAHVFQNYPEICRLYAQVFEWNLASMRVLEKAGYRRECVLRKSAVKAGEVIDLVQYALIRA